MGIEHDAITVGDELDISGCVPRDSCRPLPRSLGDSQASSVFVSLGIELHGSLEIVEFGRRVESAGRCNLRAVLSREAWRTPMVSLFEELEGRRLWQVGLPRPSTRNHTTGRSTVIAYSPLAF